MSIDNLVFEQIKALENSAMAEYKHDFPSGRAMPSDVYRALMKLMDYVYHDEEEHYRQMQADDEDVSQHIFNEARCISDWMDSPGTAH